MEETGIVARIRVKKESMLPLGLVLTVHSQGLSMAILGRAENRGSWPQAAFVSLQMDKIAKMGGE